MTSLLARYVSGECEDVWNELQRLGDHVRHPDVLDDARAVAHETVRRAKLNFAGIIEALTALDYRFDHGAGGALREPDKTISSRLAGFENALGGPLPLILRAWYEQIGAVSLMGAHPILCPAAPKGRAASRLDAEQLQSMRDQVVSDPFVMCAFDDSALDGFRRDSDPERRTAEARSRLRDFDDTLATARQSTSRFPEIFAQIETRLAPERARLEQAVRDASKPIPFRMELGPDDIVKFGESGDNYYVTLPDSGADFIIWTNGPEETFIAYLRRSFRCGGFAGWDGLPSIPSTLVELRSRLLTL